MKKLGLLAMSLMTVSLLISCGSNPGPSPESGCIVTFDVNGGSTEIESQKVKEGDYAINPKIPVARGIERLRCWSLQDEDDDNPEPFSFDTTKITSNITLHAIFDEPLSVTCTKGPMTLYLYWYGHLEETSPLNIKWSKNKKDWTELNTSLQGECDNLEKIKDFKVELNADETIYLRGNNPNGFSFDTSDYNERSIVISNDINDTESEFIVSGNPMSLVNPDDYGSFTKLPDDCFDSIFECSNVISAKNLVLASNELSEFCYSRMFSGCTKLNEAPKLPAKILAQGCYFCMFQDCSALIEAPELLVSSFDNSCERCYEYMFGGCSSINHVKVGFGENDVWPNLFFSDHWLYLVSSSGTFEWKGSDNPTTFERNQNTIPDGWQIEHVD